MLSQLTIDAMSIDTFGQKLTNFGIGPSTPLDHSKDLQQRGKTKLENKMDSECEI